MTSSMLERVIRAILAAEWNPTVNAGRIQCFGEEKPEAGNHRSFRQNVSRSSRPSQKLDIALPIMQMNVNT